MVLASNFSSSHGHDFCRFLEGKFYEEGTAAACFGAVDVRDVARAHVLALEVPAAAGQRFILSSAEAYSQLQLAQMLELEFADWPLPQKQKAVPQYCPRMDNSKAQKVLKLKCDCCVQCRGRLNKSLPQGSGLGGVWSARHEPPRNPQPICAPCVPRVTRYLEVGSRRQLTRDREPPPPTPPPPCVPLS